MVDDARLEADLRRFVVEGSLNTVFGTLIGGAFLVAFALALGADDGHVGILAALPPLLNMVQIAGSYLVERCGSAKLVCLATAAGFRLVWLIILLVPWLFLAGADGGWGVAFLLGGIGLASLFGSLSGIAWMSWITPLVPEAIRGRFFGHRSMVMSAVGMLIALFAGRFVDYWQQGGYGDVQGFSILFAVGLFFGVLGWVVLSRVTDAAVPKDPSDASFWQQLARPVRDPGFRRFIVFGTVWGFAVGIAGPFFSVYMIRSLEIPFSVIALLGLISGVFNTLGMRVWGSLIDDIGSKPLLGICSVVGALAPLLWLLTTPGNYGILWITHAITGLAWSGIGLASSHLLMSSVPNRQGGTYFAVFAAITGLSGAVAPLAGGAFMTLVGTLTWQMGNLTMGNLHIMFALTALLRFGALVLLGGVPSAKEMPTHEVLLRLRTLSSAQLMRSGQQVFTVGVNSWDHSQAYLTNGTLLLEGRLASIVDQGVDLAKRVDAQARSVERRIDSRVGRWEHFLERIVQPVVTIGSKVIRSLRDDDSADV